MTYDLQLMTFDHHHRIAGWALLAGALLGLVTMALHPTGADLLRDYDTFAPKVILAHTLAIAAVPLTFFGALSLRRRLADAGATALADFGLVSFGLASVAVLIAAVASGLIAPMIAARILRSVGTEAEQARMLFSYNGMINHGFAFVFVGAAAAAMTAWSAAILRTSAQARIPRSLGVLGLLVGLGLLVITLAGRLRLDVHHFGMVVVAQSAWWVGIGAVMARR